MAEAIGLAASIIAAVDLAGKLASRSKFYITTVKDARQDFRLILREVASLTAALKSLQFLVKHDPDFDCDSELAELFEPTVGAVGGCEDALKRLLRLIPAPDAASHPPEAKRQCIMKRKAKDAATLLGWPLNKRNALAVIDEVGRYKNTISLVILGDVSKVTTSIKRGVDEIQQHLTENEKHAIYQKLVTTNPSTIHRTARKCYGEGTGDWVLRCPEWQLWLSNRPGRPVSRCLWISGIPGAGKTILAYYLFTQLEKVHSQQHDIACVYYYCFHARNHDEAPHFLRWVVRQLCQHTNMIPTSLVDIFQRSQELDVEDLLDALSALLQQFSYAYVVLDAIDESRPRTELVRTVSCLVQDPRFERLKLLATSRDELEIRQPFTKFSIEMSMCNPLVEEDIRKVVVATFKQEREKTFVRQSDAFIANATELVVTKAKGMFRLAVLLMDTLRRLRYKAEDQLRESLMKLPEKLFEAYDRIFQLIAEEAHQAGSADEEIVRDSLSWIHHCNTTFDSEYVMPLKVLLRETKSADEEELRSLLGCLIRVEQISMEDLCFPMKYWGVDVDEEGDSAGEDSIDLDSDTHFQYTSHRDSAVDERFIQVIDFAHYSVREYLDYRQKEPMFGLGTTILDLPRRETFVEHVLALSFKVTSINNMTYDAVTVACLQAFYIHSALRLLAEWEKLIEPSHLARQLAFEFFRRTTDHFKTLRRVVECSYRNQDQSFTEPAAWLGFTRYHLHWYLAQEITNSASIVLEEPTIFTLLWTEGTSPRLAMDYIADRQVVCNESMWRMFTDNTLTFSPPSPISYGGMPGSPFQGSMLEWMLCGMFHVYFRFWVYHWPLQGLLDYLGSTVQDLPAAAPEVLPTAIAVHAAAETKTINGTTNICCWGHEAEDYSICIVDRLQSQGWTLAECAHSLTPLQMASLLMDDKLLKKLLEKGAKVNCCGHSDGRKFSQGHPACFLEVLHGASPLYIIRHHRSFIDHLRNEQDEWELCLVVKRSFLRNVHKNEANRDRVEGILLSYGAEALCAQGNPCFPKRGGNSQASVTGHTPCKRMRS